MRGGGRWGHRSRRLGDERTRSAGLAQDDQQRIPGLPQVDGDVGRELEDRGWSRRASARSGAARRAAPQPANARTGARSGRHSNRRPDPKRQPSSVRANVTLADVAGARDGHPAVPPGVVEANGHVDLRRARGRCPRCGPHTGAGGPTVPAARANARSVLKPSLPSSRPGIANAFKRTPAPCLSEKQTPGVRVADLRAILFHRLKTF